MSNFWETEYKECLSLLKYYDERHQSLVKFAAGLSSAIPSLLMSIYGLKNINQNIFWNFTLLISGLTALGLLTIFAVMVQNRLYFVYPTRQVNALRKHFLSEDGNKFNQNQMYLSTTFNAFKLLSTQTLLNLFVCLQIGLFIAISRFSYSFDGTEVDLLIEKSVCYGVITSLVIFIVASLYLHAESKKHPDNSVHRQTP